MGRSTTAQLIQRAKSMNEYNNSGIANDSIWVDFFNDALVSMVDELNIQGDTSITISPSVKTHNLPELFYKPIKIVNSNDVEITPYRDFGINLDGGRSYSPGYVIQNKGNLYSIEFKNLPAETVTLTYVRYPEILEYANRETQKPEVPTIGETALCYLAISHALDNNNQPGQARYFEEKYLLEVQKINRASFRARGE